MATVVNKGNALEPVDHHWHGDAAHVHGGGDGSGGSSSELDAAFANNIAPPDFATKILAKDGTDAAGYVTVQDVVDLTLTEPVALGTGDAQYLFNPSIAQKLAIINGTNAVPDTTLGPLLKVTRTLGHPDDAGSSDDGELLSSVLAVAVGTPACVGQPVGVMGVAKHSGSASGTGRRPDAVGVYGIGEVSGTGAAIGAFLAGQRDSDTGKLLACEMQARNYGTVAGTYNATGFTSTSGLWLSAVGNHDSGVGIQVGNPSGIQFAVGIGFNAQSAGGKIGGVANSTFRDDGNAVRSLDIRGSHFYGLDTSGGAFSAAAVRLGNAHGITARNGADDADHILLQYTSGNILSLGDPNTASIFMSQTVAMQEGENFSLGSTTGSSFGTAATQKLSFYGATPIVRQAAVPITTSGVHGALVNLGLITAGTPATRDVRDYGAVGDGVTDDTAAIVAALASGLDISVSPGRYLITADQVVAATSGQRITGQAKASAITGHGGSRFITASTTGKMLNVTGHAVSIENLCFECSGTATALYAIHAARLVNTDDIDVEIHNCGFLAVTHGAYVVGRACAMKDCVFSTVDVCLERSWPTSGTSGTGFQVLPYGFRKDRIIGNHYHSCLNFLTVSGADRIYYRGIISNNMGDVGHDFFTGAGEDLIFSGNYTKHANATVYVFDAATSQLQFIGNKLRGTPADLTNSPAHCIQFSSTLSKFAIVGNDFGDADGSCLRFMGAVSNGTIANNIFDNYGIDATGTDTAMQFDVAVATVTNVTFTGNVCIEGAGSDHAVNMPVGITLTGCFAANNVYGHAKGSSFIQGAYTDGGGNVLQNDGGSGKVTYFTDFLGDTLEDELLSGVGAGTGNAVALSPGAGGRVLLTTASDDGTHAQNGVSIGLGALDWRADQGSLVMETRLQINDITSVALFVGFTDTVGSTVEAPLFMTAGNLDSDATNACGVVFDTDATTDQFVQGGVKADTDTAVVTAAIVPVNNTYVKIRVEVSTAGSVIGFINNVPIGSAVANAVTTTTPLVPIIFFHNRSASQRTCLVDYLWVQANRSDARSAAPRSVATDNWRSDMAWVVNKAFPDEGVDPPYKHYNRKTGATPLNALTPLYAGERVLCTIDGKQYQALAATSDSWVDCGCSGPE